MKKCDACRIMLSVDAAAYERLSRVQYACNLLRKGCKETEVRQRVAQAYSCSKATAWRSVDVARDIYDTN